MAAEQGFFKKRNLDVELEFIPLRPAQDPRRLGWLGARGGDLRRPAAGAGLNARYSEGSSIAAWWRLMNSW